MSDEIERRPAGENPWYVLMTIAGEHSGQFGGKMQARSRRFWHGWIGSVVDVVARDKHCARAGIDLDEFRPFSEEERAEWAAAVAARVSGALPEAGAEIDFFRTKFEYDFSAKGFYFPATTDFQHASFSGNADFENAQFCDLVDFRKASFSRWAYFRNASFTGATSFGDGTFGSALLPNKVSFERASFSSLADFSSAVFYGSLNFRNGVFESSTSFRDAIFAASPPEFFETKIHEDTTWPDEHLWPNVPTEKYKAKLHKSAYEKLRKIMEEQKKFEEEQFFLIKGLQCNEVRDGRLRSIVSKTYGQISGYGTSMGRPAVGLLGVVVGGWLLLGLGFLFRGSCPAGMVGETGTGCMWSSLQVSLANTFPFLGAGRSTLKHEIEELIAFDWYEWLAMFQTVLGPVFLFFLLMGMRNRFRMR